MEFSDKVGVFEWIVGFEDIRTYFDKKFTLISKENRELKVLEIGSGTSTLSVSLCSELKFGEVVSIDNDAECINHMRNLYKDRTELSWFVYDMIEDRGKVQGNCLDKDGYFDIVVDKGTFDAIHVEGSISPLLEEVHRLLSVGGVYLLFSINAPDYLQSLMEIDELSFNVHVEQLQLSSFKEGTVVICKKTRDNVMNRALLALKEKVISDAHFQTDHPLLTPELEDFIRNIYRIKSAEGVLDIKSVHDLIFAPANTPCPDFLSYPMDLFLEDLASFTLETPDIMTVEEVLSFIRTMQ